MVTFDSDDGIIPHLQPKIFVGVVEQFRTFRYLTAALYVCLLLEHLYTLPQEISVIWKAPPNIVRFLFLVFRYATLAGMTLLVHSMAGLAGMLSDHLFVFILAFILWFNSQASSHSCKQTISGLSALSVLTMGIADVIVVLRVSVLWGRARMILVILLGAFFLSYSTAVVCAAIGASYLVEYTHFISVGINACVPITKPYSLLGVWGPGMAFDVLVLTLTILNTCAKPRKEQTAFTKALFKDGVVYFLALASLRALNLFMTLFSNFFLLGVCIAWPVSAIILSRFIFRVREAEGVTSSPLGSQLINDDDLEDNCHVKTEAPDPPVESARRHSEMTYRDSTAEMWEIEEVGSHDKGYSMAWSERRDVDIVE